MNGFTFFFMARPVLEILGNARFLTLYLGGKVSLLSKNDYCHSPANLSWYGLDSNFHLVEYILLP
jgi:hypothetical protein